MKSALYIENNISQIILTPENDIEKQILLLIENRKVDSTLKIGSFGKCQGGWTRYYHHTYGKFSDSDIDSLMIVMESKGGESD